MNCGAMSTCEGVAAVERTNVRVTPAHARADKYTAPDTAQLGWTSALAAA